jgi:endogenous inhibitor of DNA gyrase (YacG/DUF329 family)
VTKKSGKCPICKSATDAAYRPFCSKRCADIDLGRWLTGGYAIAGGGADADEDGDGAGRAQAAEPDGDADAEVSTRRH